MDTPTLVFGLLTVTLLGVALQAWRSGNERRDVALLGFLGAVMAMGTAISAAV